MRSWFGFVFVFSLFTLSSASADLLVGTVTGAGGGSVCMGDGFSVPCGSSRTQCLSDGSCTVWVNGALVKGTVKKALSPSK
jgi:hypothetical protein